MKNYKCLTKEENILDHCYTTVNSAYHTIPVLHWDQVVAREKKVEAAEEVWKQNVDGEFSTSSPQRPGGT